MTVPLCPSRSRAPTSSSEPGAPGDFRARARLAAPDGPFGGEPRWLSASAPRPPASRAAPAVCSDTGARNAAPCSRARSPSAEHLRRLRRRARPRLDHRHARDPPRPARPDPRLGRHARHDLRRDGSPAGHRHRRRRLRAHPAPRGACSRATSRWRSSPPCSRRSTWRPWRSSSRRPSAKTPSRSGIW